MVELHNPAPCLFTNGRILISGGVGLDAQPTFAESMLIRDGTIADIGSDTDLWGRYKDESVSIQDLAGKTVLPGFIDGHMHLLLLGQSLRKLSLDNCKSIEDIRQSLRSYAEKNPGVPRILAKGWMLDLTPEGVNPTLLDDIDPRPILIDSMDLHAVWCNSSALAELGVASMPEPKGGKIERDAHGNLTGLLSEGAVFSIVWPFLSRVMSKKERMSAIRAALSVYTSSGYTGVIDMAMDEVVWDALLSLRSEQPNLPMRFTAYWFVTPASKEACLEQVDRAIQLRQQFNQQGSPDLKIAGIKVMVDGTIDACTAYVSQPYNVAPLAEPLWNKEILELVVKRAVAGGLQVAFHAIGDKAIQMAVDTIEKCATPGGRHRIEHLELSSPEDAKRLGALGITASIQPVHSDPVLWRDWNRLVGPHRCERAFAYREFADHGALLAIGSDSPTAPYNPWLNLYVGTTRRSVKEQEAKPVNAHFRLGLCEAISAAAQGAAMSVFDEDRVGSLGIGKAADFIVVDMKWDSHSLLSSTIQETWFGGNRVWRAQLYSKF